MIIAALIAASPALATSCPQGQFYRVPATSDPLTADPPPDEVDEAAWLMIPLLRAAEARWAAMVSPLRDETPPPDPWPWLSVYGLGKRPQQ